jgi:hypothetical protein
MTASIPVAPCEDVFRDDSFNCEHPSDPQRGGLNWLITPGEEDASMLACPWGEVENAGDTLRYAAITGVVEIVLLSSNYWTSSRKYIESAMF